MKKKAKKKNFNKFFNYNCEDRQNRNFSYKDFSYSKSYNTNFKKSKFFGNNFNKAILKYCNMNNCEFKFIEFKNTNFRGSKFIGAHFENVIFQNCNLNKCTFKNVTFKNVYYINTSLSNVRGISKDNNSLIRINNQNTKVLISDELFKSLELCKKNKYIMNSDTLFYKKKNRLSNAQKKFEKTLTKLERKNLQRQRQKLHSPSIQLNKISIIRLLNVYDEQILSKGLSLAATSINKEFYSLSYFIPYIKKFNKS